MKKFLLLLLLLPVFTWAQFNPIFFAGTAVKFSFKNYYTTSPNISGHGVYVTTDGLNLYTTDAASGTIYQYKMSIAFDVSTSTFWDSETSVISPVGIRFSNDGIKIIIANSLSRVYYATLSTPFDLTTMGVASFVDYSSQVTSLLGVDFNSAGTEMYLSGTGGISRYALSTPFTVTSSTFVSTNNNSQWLSLDDLCFSNNGLSIYTSKRSDKTYNYTLSSPYDLSTITKTYNVGVNNILGIYAIPLTNNIVTISGSKVSMYLKNY